MRLLQEFKTFAARGNVIDMAVGVIIGAAFGKIVSSLVADVITPPLGLLLGGVNFSALAITLQAASGDQPAVVIAYGKFIQTIIDFLIVAWAIFLGLKAVNTLKKKETPPPAAPPAPSPEQALLSEIRDLLRQQTEQKSSNKEK